MLANVVSGRGKAHEFVSAAEDELAAALSYQPFPGTLNLDGGGSWDLNGYPCERIVEVGDDDYCTSVDLIHCRVNGVLSSVIVPDVPHYPTDKIELLAPVSLRTLFELTDGDEVSITQPDRIDDSKAWMYEPAALDSFESIVFDFDGTLAHLPVDWQRVRNDLKTLFGADLSEPLSSYTPEELHALAVQTGKRAAFRDCLAEHEHAAIEETTRLPLLGQLSDYDCPIAICTLNATSVVETVLEQADQLSAVDVLVGRETLDEQKPHPAPLRRCFEQLGVAPEASVFVGDDRRDFVTASRTPTSFVHAT